MTSPVCKVFDKSIDSSQKISSNNKEYRITPVGSKDVAISRNTEAPKKDKPLVQFAPAPADALAPPGRNPDHHRVDENEDTADDIEYDYIDTEAMEDPGKVRAES
uniref:Uncharacterized protein n=1 Tax=Caenorhabditis japonica TaxID=281687 RepID=A0A8R1ILL6_CAEJA